MSKSYALSHDIELNPRSPQNGQANPSFDLGSSDKIVDGKKETNIDFPTADDEERRKHATPTEDEDISPKELKLVQDDFEDMPSENPGRLEECTGRFFAGIGNFLKKNKRMLKILFVIILAILYLIYFGYAMHVEKLKNEDSIRLLWVTCAVVFFVAIYFIKRVWGDRMNELWERNVSDPWTDYNDRRNNRPLQIILGIIAAICLIGIVVALVLLVGMKDPYNLVSLVGIFLMVLSGYIGSTNPDRIKWRPVLVGLLLQFIFALLILKTTPGYEVFKFLGDRVSEFLDHTNAGASFVFDIPYPPLEITSFAFRVLPIVIFFSTFVSVLYHIGLMQLVIEKVAWVMQFLMGTTAGESLNAAGNIFVGMTEAPLMIRPFIGLMTNSELHAVMTGGFATIAGSVLGAYISFGVPANHLISASVMSAPAALAMAKLFYPETKKSKNTAQDVVKMEGSPYKNLIEAATGGALASIPLVANIAASLIAFLALLEFINQTLTWFGSRAGMTEKLTFQLICSYILWPLAFVMGVAIKDCRRVAELIGVKTFLNEYIGYTQLAALIKNRKSFESLTMAANITNPALVERGMDIFVPALNKTFTNGFFTTARSEVIATYSLCGFANIGSIGILLGGLSAMAPHRRRDMAGFITRAMIAGNIACFITACIAGLLFDPTV